MDYQTWLIIIATLLSIGGVILMVKQTIQEFKYRQLIKADDEVIYQQNTRTKVKAKIVKIEGNKVTITTEVSRGEIYPVRKNFWN